MTFTPSPRPRAGERVPAPRRLRLAQKRQLESARTEIAQNALRKFRKTNGTRAGGEFAGEFFLAAIDSNQTL